MSEESRAAAHALLAAAADRYRSAQAELAAAEAEALDAAFAAKQAGLSQHDIATAMGSEWANSHNPQYPPVTDL